MIAIDRDAEGARIAIVDSGIDVGHPWFAGATIEQLSVTARAGVLSVERAELGDASGHGTACAGIIHRLAPKARISSVRALGAEGRGSREALVAALRFCVAEGFSVVNLSLGIDVPRSSPLRPTDYRSVIDLYEVADEAYSRGVMLVAAGPNAATFRTYPGRAKSLIGVGRGSFSDPERFDLELTADHEILAPGVDVVGPALGGGERRWTGTSFACPHVAAHVARVVASRPGSTPSDVRSTLHQLALEQRAHRAAEEGARERALAEAPT